MVQIDFLKIEEFSRLNDVSKIAFRTAVGVDLAEWKSEDDEEKNNRWLMAAADLFNVPPRVLQVNTLRVVLEDLIERSWENSKSIDRDGILHGDIGELELTLAESILLYEGSQTGIANCTLQMQDKFEYRGITGKPNLIRAELIEWLLNPSISKLLIKSGSLSIIGAEISVASGRLFESIRQHVNVDSAASTLNLSNSIIDKDLFFTDCVFHEGLNLDNSSVQSLLFNRCEIIGNFTANNLVTNGDVRFFPKALSGNSTKQSIDVSVESKFDISGYFWMNYANVSGIIDLSNLKVKNEVSLVYLSSELVMLNALECAGSLHLTGGEIKKMFSMNSINIQGNIDGPDLKCQTLLCANSMVFGWVDFQFLRCDNASFSGSHFLGDEVSLNLACCEVINIMLADGFFAKCGVYVFRSRIMAMLDCSESLCGPDKLGYAFVAKSSQIEMLRLNNSVFVGSVSVSQAKINIKLSFESSVFVAPPRGPDQPRKKAIDGSNLITGKEVSFKPLSEIVQNRYEVISQLKMPEKLDANSTKEQDGAFDVTLSMFKKYAKPLALLREIRPEYFKSLDEVVCHKCYNKLSSLIIGEASFENAEINGRIDCAGAIFFNSESLDMPRENTSQFKKIDDWFSATILGRFIAFVYLIPLGTLQLITRMINWIYRNVAFAPKSVAKRMQKNAEWANFLDVWLTPKPVDWPNALTLSHTRINGDLFLNKGPKGEYAPFCAIGEVDLHSAKIENFFLSPDIGAEPLARWRIIGLKYDFIYSNDSMYESLEYCNWFFDYTYEDNFRQPYEQLAASYLKMGDDTNARKVLMQTPGRGVGEKILMAVLAIIAYISLPSYRALAWLIILWLCGVMIFNESEDRKEIIRENKENAIVFSPKDYSFQLLIPFISAPQKDAFEPSYIPHTRDPIYIPFRPSWLPEWIPRQFRFDWVYAYHTTHSFLGTILISLFLLGIARIIRNP